MQPHPRYDIIEQIAVGDFATVFRARDRELNREVAIKQIHPQFLADERQLERYWQEAQLLASLEHPNIMTIYDIDRTRGWLILELMAESMHDRAGGQPLDLNFLRLGLVCGLQALNFLHRNKITHGDVKPRNLLIDRRNWVKLGDFGLAQRATNDQGSLFKGTTRYIAPERVSDQFGPVGPASDLYSLGFSTYELMCGEAFDSLFPGLSAFGRDQQIAWMMWHAAPDRKVPEIGRVLEGVPEDLQGVIARLTTKDPAIRYRAADEAIRDLKTGMGLGPGKATEAERAEAEAAAAQAAKNKRQKVLYIAAAASLLLCGVLYFLPAPKKPLPPPKLHPVSGTIKHMFPEKIVVDTGQERDRRTVTLLKNDQLYLNDMPVTLADLKPGDFLTTTIDEDEAGKPFQIMNATRARRDRGTLISFLPGEDSFWMQPETSGDIKPSPIKVRLPKETIFEFNGKRWSKEKPVKLSHLHKGDFLDLRHNAEGDRRVAVALTATRSVTTPGTLQGVDLEKNTLTMRTKESGHEDLFTLPLTANCEVIINDRKFLEQRPLTASDLEPGDKVRVQHNTHVTRIVANRVRFGVGIIERIIPSQRIVEIKLESDAQSKSFTLVNNGQLTLGGEKINLDSLQPGDRVQVNYDAADPQHPIATKIEATRASERNRWALVVGISDYDDQVLSPVGHLAEDAQLFYDALIKRYRLAPDQTLLLKNVVRYEMKSEIERFLSRVKPESELIVYFAGHGYLGRNKTPYLAAKNSDLLHLDKTGIPLKWLVDEIENCTAKDKLLLLDTGHEGSGSDLQDQPSSKEFVLQLELDRTNPALKSLVVLASSETGQRGMRGAEHGHFALALEKAYRGLADRDRDQQLSRVELMDFLKGSLNEATGGRQVPALVEPRAAIPARLSPEAILALKRMILEIGKKELDMATLGLLADEVEDASPGQPEVQLLYGIAELKSRNAAKAIETFNTFREIFPQQQLLAVEGIAGAFCAQKKYNQATSSLILLVSRAGQKSGANERLSNAARRILPWVGRLREYAATAAAQKNRLSTANALKIDEAAAAAGEEIEQLYQRGREQIIEQRNIIDARFPALRDKSQRVKLERIRRTKLADYVSFPWEGMVEQVRGNIED